MFEICQQTYQQILPGSGGKAKSFHASRRPRFDILAIPLSYRSIAFCDLGIYFGVAPEHQTIPHRMVQNTLSRILSLVKHGTGPTAEQMSRSGRSGFKVFLPIDRSLFF